VEFNTKKFRLSIYQQHKITGLPPMRELTLTTYRSADDGGKQKNYSLQIGLTTFHLQWRSILDAAI